jgi:hypothetical protein
MKKIKIRFYDVNRDLHTWSEWIDCDSLEFNAVKNWKDIDALVVAEWMTREQAKEFLEKFK